MTAKMTTALALGAILASAAACEPIRRSHGYVPQPGALSTIEPGADGKAEVARKIGRPTTTGAFESDEWYYIARQTETRAFFAPRTTNQEVVVVAFDADGKAEAPERYGLEDGKVVNLVTRTTPTRGKRLTFLQQLLGNIGRFNPGQVFGGDRAIGGL